MSDKCAITAIAAGLAVIITAFSITFYSLTRDDLQSRAHAGSILDGKPFEHTLIVPLGTSNG